MKFFKIALCFIMFVTLHYQVVDAQTTPWSEKMANTISTNYPKGFNDGGRTWSYVVGTVLSGFELLYEKTGNVKYKTYIETTVANEFNADSTMKTYKVSDYNSDQVREGQALIFLNQQSNGVKFRTALKNIRSQLNTHPRTSEGGFWHKQVYPYQMWQDGLYMVEPFYARYNVVFNNSSTADFDDIAKQFIILESHARDQVTGLIYHGWDEKKVQNWANPTTGCSSCFWGRAMGWYGMALVDVLDYFPESHPKRAELIAIFQRLMSALVKYQEPTSKCWYQVVDYTTPGYGAANGNYLESTASIMFSYCLLKGSRKGYLDNTYLTNGINAYEGVLKTFVTESNNLVTVNKACAGAGLSATRNGTFTYYINETITSASGIAMGAFMLASLEYEKVKVSGLADNKLTQMSIHQSFPDKKLVFEGIDNAQNPVKVKIISLNGQVLKSGCISNYYPVMDISGVLPNVYMVQIQNEGFSSSRKIVIV